METDLKIRSNLKAENRSTTFLITHRIASAKDCDVILVLDDGKIAQQGTHEELLKQEGLYRRIAEIQDLEGGRDDG
jgi:ATP-binding cassette subfamily B protein